jgi:ribonuclease HI
MKCKLLQYFKSRSVRVVTSHRLGEIVRNHLTMGRIAKWALRLMGLDITYVLQMAIKSLALADVVAKWIETQKPPAPVTREHWSMYFDDSFTLNGAGRGIILISPKLDRLRYAIWLHFCTTNNVAQYEALVNSLRVADELGVQRLYISGDFELIINKIMGESNCHDPLMVAYRQEVRKLKEKFNDFELHHIL